MTLQEKITNKENEIGKLVKKFDKYSKEIPSEEFIALINQYLRTGDYTPLREFKVRNFPNNYYLPGIYQDLYSIANDLYTARNTLNKYNKQKKAEADKQATLENLPHTLIKFKDNLINKWDEYDTYKKQRIKEDLKKEPKGITQEYRNWQSYMRETYGRSWRDFLYLSEEQIHKNNVKDAENLILNLINRTIEKTGTIIDTSNLHLSYNNRGYSIINGKIIGETGTATVTSIEAGGYNIQRYHIRVLVK